MNARDYAAWTSTATLLASPAAARTQLLDLGLLDLGLLLPRPSAAC